MISKPIYSFCTFFLTWFFINVSITTDFTIYFMCVCMSKPIGAWLSRFKPIICRFEINLCKCLMQINHIFSLTIHLGRSDSCRRLKLGGSQNRHIKIGKWLQIYKLPITTITLFSLCQRVSGEEILDFFFSWISFIQATCLLIKMPFRTWITHFMNSELLRTIRVHLTWIHMFSFTRVILFHDYVKISKIPTYIFELCLKRQSLSTSE